MERPCAGAGKAGTLRTQRGISVLELTASLVVIALLAGVLAQRLLDGVRLSEQAAVRQTVAALRLAMHLEVGRRAGAGDLQAVRRMAGENPVRWLTQPPGGYLGELDGPDMSQLPGGSWHYDTQRREIVYAPRRMAWDGLPSDALLRFQVRMLGQVGISGVELAAVEDYGWLRR